MILPVPIPLEVGDTPVVLRRFLEHPLCQRLLADLKQRAEALAERHPDVRLL